MHRALTLLMLLLCGTASAQVGSLADTTCKAKILFTISEDSNPSKSLPVELRADTIIVLSTQTDTLGLAKFCVPEQYLDLPGMRLAFILSDGRQKYLEIRPLGRSRTLHINIDHQTEEPEAEFANCPILPMFELPTHETPYTYKRDPITGRIASYLEE